MILKTPLPRLSRALLVIVIVCLATIFAGVIFVTAQGDKPESVPPADAKAKIAERLSQLPMSFELNKGQTAAPVKFISRGLGYQLFLTGNEAVLKIQKAPDANVREGSVLRLKMLGANTAPGAEGQDELPGKVNYFNGNDPNRWLRNLPTYARVNFKDVYPGIDLVYYGNQGELEYDFAVAPGADPKLIRFVIDGADKIRLDENGDLLLSTPQGDVRLHKPVLYQLTDGKRDEVKGEYVIKGNEIRFKVRSFDSSKPLVIDPVLSYSTFLGGGSNEQSFGIAVDSQGSSYVVGTTSGFGFPTTAGAFRTTIQSGGAFVSKLDPTGSSLVYSTYLSATGGTNGTAIAIDAGGNAYVTGFTSANDFPIVNGLKTSGNFFKTTDAAANWNNKNDLIGEITIVAVAPNSPNTIYAGTFNGPYRSTDAGATWTKTSTTGLSGSLFFVSMAVDPTNSQVVYVGSQSGGLRKSSNGGDSWTNVNIPLNNSTVSSIVFDPVTPSTMYVGAGNGVFRSTDSGTTWTALNNFPLPFIPAVRVLAIDPANTATIYAGSFNQGLFKTTNGGANWTAMNSGMGGSNPNSITAIAIDPFNTSTIYTGHGTGSFTGFGGSINKSTNGGTSWTQLTNGVSTFQISAIVADRTTANTFYAATLGDGVIKTTNGGASWSNTNTSLWQSNVQTLVADPSNAAILYAGTTGSRIDDAFVAKLNSTGSGLIFSTYLGGSSTETGNGIAVDSNGNIFVVGQTLSTNFPTVNALQPVPSAGEQCTNAFVTKINPGTSSFSFSTYLGGSNCDGANSVALDPSGNVYITGTTSSTDFFTASAFQTTASTSGDAFVTKLTNGGSAIYSTYLGGNGTDAGRGIAADSSGNAYVTGSTSSTNFPTVNPLQVNTTSGGAFVTKLNPQGSALIYSTLLGGGSSDVGRGIAVDAAGNAYVTGATSSYLFPVLPGALRTKSPLFKSLNAAGNWSNDNYGLTVSAAVAIALHPTQTSTIYAGTSNGVYKTTNAGRTWTAINNGLNSLQVTAIVIDPATPSTLYVATNDTSFDSGVYKSTNGGDSWTLRRTGMVNGAVVCLAIDPVTPSVLYAGASGGPLYKTTNGADNWTPSGPSANHFVASIAVDPHNHARLFAAVQHSNGGVFRSIDSGATWEPIGFQDTGSATFVGVSPITPGLVYTSTLSGGLFKSTDNGNNWTSQQNQVGQIVFDPVNASTLYLLAQNNGLLKSIDGGQTWVPVKGLPSPFVQTLVIDRFRPSTLYLGTGAAGQTDAFVTKINSTGTALIYSTLMGQPSSSEFLNATGSAFGIAIDTAGNAYITGSGTAGFPTTPNAFQPFNGGFTDSFISKLSSSYIISGHVLENGVTPSYGAEVVLNDGSSLTSVFTESDGSYEFSHLREGGNFTVSASKVHFTMAPPSQTFNNVVSDHNLDFSANTSDAPFYTISGQVTDNGAGLSGVTVTLSGSQSGLRTTDNNGNYSFELIAGGNYTVTPSILGYTFAPPSQTFNPLSGPQTVNFTANRQDFVVTNANNHGSGSLREAITNANASPGTDKIVFNIPGPGVKTINLLTALPDVTETVIIDATTQPGYAGSPLIELSGALVSDGSGITIRASGSTVRGLSIGGFNDWGIALRDCDNNIIQANYIGIDATGTLARKNFGGILVANSANNLIGGTTAAARNVISGNGGGGIDLSGTNNVIQGNFIGTNAAGTSAVLNTVGVQIQSSQFINNLIGGTAPGAGNLISGNQRAIAISAPNNTVQGNLIGTDVTGTVALPNSSLGIDIRGANNLVGGVVPGARNVISANGSVGIMISGPGSKLQGNYIGTDITGTVAMGNGGTGVVADDSALIGGTTPEARNVISANATSFGSGNVSIGDPFGANVTVQGNYIGTDVTGTRALGSALIGINVSRNGNHLIGGTVAGAGNVISGHSIGIDLGDVTANLLQGTIVQGNLIGLNAAGTGAIPNTTRGIIVDSSSNIIGGIEARAANKIAFNNGPGILINSGTNNSIRGNSIFSNAGLGIDLGPPVFPQTENGVTPNDPNDVDTGANTLQNFPILTSVTTGGGNTTIQGSLNSTPNQAFQIDFYSNAALDPSGNGEGALFFNTTSVNTDANGNATINVTFPMSLAVGRIITATATNAAGNTSEFSATPDGSGATGSLQFSAASFAVIEGIGMATITVVRQGGTNGNLSVEYATENGTATAGQDYTAASGTLNFSNGETSKTIQIPISDDGVTETDETFTVALRNGSSLEALGAPSVQTVTIQDHGTVPFITIFDAAPVVEGNTGTSTEAVFNVVLSAATSQSVSVNYATSNAGASGGVACGNPGVDYESKSGTITFQPGTVTATVTVKVCGDTSAEANEFFFVNLSNPVNASLGVGAGLGRINNDDVLGLILEESGPGVGQAVVLSELFLRDPLTLTIPDWITDRIDRRNRVIFLANNLQLNPGEASFAVVVRFIGSNNQQVDVQADDVRSVPGFDFTQVMVKLPGTLPPGTCTVTIRAHGRVSNIGTIRIAP